MKRHRISDESAYFYFSFRRQSSSLFKKLNSILLTMQRGCFTLLGLSEQYVSSAKQRLCPVLGMDECVRQQAPCPRGFPLYTVSSQLEQRPLHPSVGWKELPFHREKKKHTKKLAAETWWVRGETNGKTGGDGKKGGHSRKREDHVWNHPLP